MSVIMRSADGAEIAVGLGLRASVAVTPSDSAVLSPTPVGLFIGVGGDVSFCPVGGGTVTWPNVPSASIIPVAVTKVMATSTTANSIFTIG